ncbi:MAG: LCP family protein [Anaerolineales bacterium]|nr:LCP family protein [Anaerolineales bacterium]
MKRLIPLNLVLVLVLTACGQAGPLPLPPLPVAVRTTVPTWTLPFDPNATPSVTPPGVAAAAPATAEAGAGAAATATPTARPGIDPTLGAATPDPFSPPVTPIPEPMPQLFLEKDVINILLLGRDTARDSASYRTDVMIVVSVNKAANSVTLLTLPRDLFVYIPGWTMNRLNTAAAHGDSIGYPGGGVALLEQTILYNLGIPLHGWARIDFGGFKQVIDILGGVEVPVSCAMQDWRLKDPYDPNVDVQNADNWELYTVEPGLQAMDGDLALWYARSRKRSSDFDRSRRQHQVLRAMLEKGLQLNMLPKAPELYQQYVQIVDTDLGLGDVLQFVPLAAQLDRARIKSRFIGRAQVWSWTTPAGAAVLLPDRAAIQELLAEAFQPPPANTLARSGPAVEIVNGTRRADYPALAADNLNWAGITPVIGPAQAAEAATTTLYDYSTSPKGSLRAELQRLFNLTDANVVAAPDPNAAYPYRVVLGADYVSCVTPPQVIHATPTPGPGAPFNPDDVVHAARVLEPPPGVDGDLGEWAMLVYPAAEAGFGAQNWRGPADLSASWNLAWDDRYLYLAVKVKDDVLVPPPAGEGLFRGDTLELWVSIDPGQRGEQLSEREFQLGLSPGDLAGGPGRPEMHLWLPKQFQGPVKDAVVAARAVEGGYALEAAVPWEALGLAPFATEGFGFTLAVNDDDTPGSAEQETQVVNVKGARLPDPRTWGVMTLDPPPGP